ncbi:hypothetical protein ENUP19_0306G0010 [Entamoeba nuttalli]|uniref:Uncharacterized protein n=2 Tax=Entamoeba nuttalli TaxID=412467 RepID=K2H0N6_ENTNP|nr:hypothetical protein ENU1_070050 [Entamoeba nuttalli P19]EKE41038.1 hypothetical protein ENU1_070050 [Entamoeba nuttalli P19]|eukprot:XP_008856628.1 hypothetical protein ENU1_070050 [Entamoeba nuttalli P19]
MNPNTNGSVISNSISTPQQPIDRSHQQQRYQQPQYQTFPNQQVPVQYQGQPMYQPRVGYQSEYIQPQVQQPQNNFIDIPTLQGLIEQYLQFYYTDDEIIRELEKKSIPTEMTIYILTKLKEQNPNYFKAYEIRLTIKGQIARFNELIQKHLTVSNTVQPETTPIQQVPQQQFTQDIYQENFGGSYISGAYQGDQSMGM